MGDIKIEKRNKCVYRHITLDTNKVFYVGIFIKEHVSQAQAKRELGMGLSIGAVLSNKKKTAGGFIWKYKEECLINTNKKK